MDRLLSNDVLSEGSNLQQVDAVVSYDMLWNPQRMVQRYGRLIRPKSPHDEVCLTNMLPEASDVEEIIEADGNNRPVAGCPRFDRGPRRPRS